MNETPNYYAILPAEVRYDTNLSSSAKLLYAEITALSNKKGYCWATNSYFAELYKVDVRTISEWVSLLNNAGYVKVEIRSENKRKIYLPLLKKFKGVGRKAEGGDSVKPEDNTTSINIKDNIILHSEQSSHGKVINSLISLFKPVNIAYKQLFMNKTQRKALERLLVEMGEAKLTNVLQLLPQTNVMRFAPKITTPCELERLIGRLQAFLEEYKHKQINIVKI